MADVDATLKMLIYAAQGGNAQRSTADLMRWIAVRLVEEKGDNPNSEFIRALHERATMLDDALFQAKHEVGKSQAYAPDGRTWRQLAYSEAAKRGQACGVAVDLMRCCDPTQEGAMEDGEREMLLLRSEEIIARLGGF